MDSKKHVVCTQQDFGLLKKAFTVFQRISEGTTQLTKRLAQHCCKIPTSLVNSFYFQAGAVGTWWPKHLVQESEPYVALAHVRPSLQTQHVILVCVFSRS